MFHWITQNSPCVMTVLLWGWSGRDGPNQCVPGRGPFLTESETWWLPLPFLALAVGGHLYKWGCWELEEDCAGLTGQASGGRAATPVRPCGFWGEIWDLGRRCPKGWATAHRCQWCLSLDFLSLAECHRLENKTVKPRTLVCFSLSWTFILFTVQGQPIVQRAAWDSLLWWIWGWCPSGAASDWEVISVCVVVRIPGLCAGKDYCWHVTPVSLVSGAIPGIR